MHKASHKKNVFINTILHTLGAMPEKFLLFIIVVLISRYLSVEQYGEYSTALALATLFSMFANLNLNTAIIRSINKYKTQKNEYFTASLVVKSLLSVIAYAALVVFVLLAGYNRNTILLTLILGLMRIGTEYIGTSYAYYEAHEKFRTTSIILFTYALAFLAGTAIVILFKGDYFGLVNVRLIITIIFLIIISILVSRTYKFKFDFRKTRKFLKSMIPFSGSYALQSLCTYIGNVLLPLIHSTFYAGIYQNAWQIFAMLILAHGILVRVLTPFLYKFSYAKNRDKFQYAFELYSRIFGIMSFYLSLVFFLNASGILIFIFKLKYADAIPALKLFALALPFVSIAPIIITTIGKQKINTRIDAIVAFLYLITSVILIYFFKVEGAAASTVFFYMCYYAISNGYLVFIKRFKYMEVFYTNLKLVIGFLVIFIFHHEFLSSMHFIPAIIIDTVFYLAFLFCFIIKKDDYKILKELYKAFRKDDQAGDEPFPI